MKKSFKNIIKDLETFCDEHKQINSFNWGELSEVSTKDMNYPSVFVQPVPGAIVGTMMMLSFEVYVFDVTKQDRSNLLEVMSDMLLVGNDIISQYFDDEDEFDFTLDEDGVTITPFEAKFDDYTAGWIFDINIEVANSYNTCAIPKD